MTWTDGEPTEILVTFTGMLAAATGDGAKKRQAGEKVSWKVDDGHWPAAVRHIIRWEGGEKVDADSLAHPLVHAAWRLLAVAHQETEARRLRTPYFQQDIFGTGL